MEEGGVLPEGLQEKSGQDAAGAACGGVIQIGIGGFEQLPVLREVWHLGKFFAGDGGQGCDARKDLRIRGQCGGADAAEEIAHAAGQPSDLQQLRGVEGAHAVGHGVRHGEAALRVGVADKDGLAAHGAQHVAVSIAVGVHRVFTGRHRRHYIPGQLLAGDGAHGADHGGGAVHVKAHGLHAALFDGEPAAVVGDPLAHQGDGGLVPAAAPAHHDQAGLQGAALGHRQKESHAQGLAGLPVQNLHGKAPLVPQRLTAAGQLRRRQHVGQLVDKVAGCTDALRQHQPLIQGGLAGGVCQQCDGAVMARLFLTEIGVKLIFAEGEGAGDLLQELGLRGEGHPVQPVNQDRFGLILVQRGAEAGHRGAKIVEGRGYRTVKAHEQQGCEAAVERQAQGAQLLVPQRHLVSAVYRPIGLLQRRVGEGDRRVGGKEAKHSIRTALSRGGGGKFHGNILISVKGLFVPIIKAAAAKGNHFS